MYKFVFLKLEAFNNNKLIAEEKDLINVGNVNELGASGYCCFNPQSLPSSQQIIEFECIPFIFPDKASEKFDNISCEGQLINVYEENYLSVHILGCCEFYDFKEKIKLTYVDEFIDEDIWFHNCLNGNILWNYDILEYCKTAITAKNMLNEPIYIYYHKINLNKLNKPLKAIQLPLNDEMHIFAITLEKRLFSA